jgi:hypothetical protein
MMKVSMKCPVTELLERLELSRKVFCMAHGASFSSLSNCLNGISNSVPDSILNAFRRAGISREDLEGIQERYAKWKKEAAHEMIAQKRKEGKL